MRIMLTAATILVIGLASTLGFTMASGQPVSGPDTVVGMDPGGATDPKRLAIKPEGWVQPAYEIWVTATCADTLNIGDPWPSANPACQ